MDHLLEYIRWLSGTSPLRPSLVDSAGYEWRGRTLRKLQPRLTNLPRRQSEVLKSEALVYWLPQISEKAAEKNGAVVTLDFAKLEAVTFHTYIST